MAGVNKVILVGNVGMDPELRNTPGGQAVLSFRLATTTSYYNSNTKQRGEDTQWHTVVMWGPRGESLGKILQRGTQCYVEGRLQTRSWESKTGEKRYTTEVVATEVELLGSKPGPGKRGESWSPDGERHVDNPTYGHAEPSSGDDDNLPF